MKLLRAGLCDEYVITAHGKFNVHQAEEVCRYITKWIKIVKIDFLRDSTGGQINIRFKRSPLFKAAFDKIKRKVEHKRIEQVKEKKVAKHNTEVMQRLEASKRMYVAIPEASDFDERRFYLE